MSILGVRKMQNFNGLTEVLADTTVINFTQNTARAHSTPQGQEEPGQGCWQRKKFTVYEYTYLSFFDQIY